MTTQLQQCREVAAALDEEVTEWRRKDAEWREHRNAAEKALHDMPFVMDNYRAALARAEAAEAEAAEARATNEALAELAASETKWRVALAARASELKATTAWRPVTEDWPPYGVQHLGRALSDSPTMLITRHVDADDNTEVWQNTDGLLFYGDEIRYCAAIPEGQPLAATP